VILSKTKWAYIAGFFDGEGNIGIHRNRQKYAVKISITNTNLAILKFIRLVMGGSIYQYKLLKPEKHNLCYSLQTNQRPKQLIFLKNILPHSVLKKIPVSLVIKFIESRTKRGVIPGSHLPYNKYELSIIKRMRTRHQKRGKIKCE
jgi:hypothetical protein